MRDFFLMGGYAFYVWSAYALTAVVLIANLWHLHRLGKRTLRSLHQRHNDSHLARILREDGGC